MCPMIESNRRIERNEISWSEKAPPRTYDLRLGKDHGMVGLVFSKDIKKPSMARE